MKIAHLIPTSFEYFEDIREEAFALVEAQNNLGLEVEAFTLQYGKTKPTLSEVEKIEKKFVSRQFAGNLNISEVIKILLNFDVVHIHVPFFGGLKKIINWKRSLPSSILVVTYYRKSTISDLFSYVVKWYNNLMLPKLFQAADLVAYFTPDQMSWELANKAKLLEAVDYSANLQNQNVAELVGRSLKPEERLAAKYLIIYQELQNKKLEINL